MHNKKHEILAAALLALTMLAVPAAAVEIPIVEHAMDVSGAVSATYPVDLDGDGDTDILGRSNGVGLVWWENPGGVAATDGTPWNRHTIAGPFFSDTALDAADVDRDGDTDILQAVTVAGEILWWENPGGTAATDGTLWIKHTIDGAFDGPTSLDAADLDGDGDTDVLGVATDYDQIAWWENPGGAAATDGTPWTRHTIDGSFDHPFSVNVADVDGDGDRDILGAAGLDNEIAWWENPGGGAATDGTPWTKHTIDGAFDGAGSVHAADVDGDGDTDIVGGALLDDEIAWWENPGGTATTDGTPWTKHTVDGAFGFVTWVFAADMDGDGDTDILGAAYDDDEIAWWENPGGAAATDGTPWTKYTIDGEFDSAESVYAADVDGDGDVDILGHAFLYISWWENGTIHRNAVHPIEHAIDGAFSGATSVYATDVDGDGDTDILGAAYDADEIAWWENPGAAAATDGTPWTKHTIDGLFNAANAVHAADVDGDGDTDILGGARLADDITWWENPGGAAATDGTPWTEHTIDGSFDGPFSVYAADVDGDGDTDILGAAQDGDQIAWWENPGGAAATDGTPWTKHTIDGSFDGAFSVYAADVDGDGDTDILGAARIADDITWWENPGGAAATDGTPWTEHTIDGGFGVTVSVYAADVDGDGDTDVLGAGRFNAEIAWWENPGGAATTDGTPWTERTIDGSFGLATAVYAADMDGDGDTDILGAALGGNEIAWWENPGGAAATDGTPWTDHTVDGSYSGAYSVYATDVDGDGDTDILGAARFGNEITWWENRGGQFGLPTTDTSPALVLEEELSEVLKITATHNGRAGDHPAELVTFDLLLEETAGDPLSDVEADALLNSLRIYLDDDTGAGAGSFQPAEDRELANITTFSLTAGVQTVSFADGDIDAQLEYGTDRSYFVVIEPAAVGPITSFLLTHQTANTSTGEDADFDIPLALEYTVETTAMVTVTDNNAPTASAGPDQLLQAAAGGTAAATLDGSASSDPDSDALTYTWTGAFPEGGGTVTGVMPLVTLGPGANTVTLEVDDGNGGMDTDTVDILVNQMPAADAGPDQLLQIAAGGTAAVTLDGSGSSDGDGDALTYTWTGAFPEGGGTVTGVSPMVTLGPGVHLVTLTVDDGNGAFDSGTVTIAVNQPTVADAGPDQALRVSGGTAAVTLDGSASSDADGDTLTYTWTGAFAEGGGTVMGVMPMVTLGPGIHTITLTVDDGNANMSTDTVVITVSNNQAPVANAGPNQNHSAAGPGGLQVKLNGSASSDPDSDPLNYTWTGPFGTATGVSPTVQIPGGVHPVTLTIDDGRGGADSDSTMVTVTTLAVSPGALTFTMAQGAASDAQPFTVQALGGAVAYSIPETAAWLRASSGDGSSSGEKDTIQAIVDPGDLNQGTYMASLFVNGGGVIQQSVQVTLIVTGSSGAGEGPQTPKPFANGVVDTADFIPFGEPGHPVAPQSIVSIYGADFVAEGEFLADSIPLPTMLGGVTATFDGIQAGLFFVSPGLIIAELPAGVTLPAPEMIIENGGAARAASAPLRIQVAEYSPGIFTLTQNGQGQAIVVHSGTADLAAPAGAVGNSRPAAEGDYLTIYANGLGPVDPPIEDRHNSCEPGGVCLPDGSNAVLHHTLTKPIIRIGGVEVPAENVLFSGSSPASVGANEVVFIVPPGVPTGDAVSLTIEIGSVVSKETTVAVGPAGN